MRPTVLLEFEDALKIARAAEAEAKKNHRDVTIAICDASGTLLCLHRLNGAPLMSAQIAEDKAKCSVITGKASKIYEEMVNNGRTAALNMPIVPLEGGEPIIINDICIGAVGISGVKAFEDAQIARAGIAALH